MTDCATDCHCMASTYNKRPGTGPQLAITECTVEKMIAIVVVACTLMLPLVKTLEWRRISDPDALCNDFTRAGYYIRRNYSSSDWLVFLEGGGVCYSAETCNRRYVATVVKCV